MIFTPFGMPVVPLVYKIQAKVLAGTGKLDNVSRSPFKISEMFKSTASSVKSFARL